MSSDRNLIPTVFSDEIKGLRIGILQLYDCQRCNEKRCLKIYKGRLSLFKEYSEKIENKEMNQGTSIDIRDGHYTPNGDYHIMRLVFDKDVRLLNTYETYFEKR